MSHIEENIQNSLQSSQWHLPTIQELFSIIDHTRFNPATNIENIIVGNYWSSTPHVTDATVAWIVNFYHGNLNAYYKYNDYYVRCVRKIGDKLQWSKPIKERMDWQEACKYCKELNK